MLIRIAALREYGWRGNAAKQENGGGARHPWHSPKFIFLAKHRPALAETKGRGRTLCLRANRCAATADGMGWGRRISQVALAPSPLCPRSLPRETDCIQTRGANCSRGARVQEPNYGHGALLCARTATGHAVTEQADELASGAVGTRVTSCPPLRSVHAAFPHTAPTSGV